MEPETYLTFELQRFAQRLVRRRQPQQRELVELVEPVDHAEADDTKEMQ